MTNKIKILVVDDNVSFLEMLSEFLSENGYEVLVCNNGKVALEQFTAHVPNIILTDIIMPEVDGIELLLSLRKINPNVKVIAMSGGNQGHAGAYLQMAEKLGANSVLNKPFELSTLLAELKKIES